MRRLSEIGDLNRLFNKYPEDIPGQGPAYFAPASPRVVHASEAGCALDTHLAAGGGGFEGG